MKINVAPRYLTSAPIGSTVYDSDGDIWEARAVSTFIPEGPHGRLDMPPHPIMPPHPSEANYSLAWSCNAKETAYVVATIAYADQMYQDHGPFSKEVTPYGLD